MEPRWSRDGTGTDWTFGGVEPVYLDAGLETE